MTSPCERCSISWSSSFVGTRCQRCLPSTSPSSSPSPSYERVAKLGFAESAAAAADGKRKRRKGMERSGDDIGLGLPWWW